MSRQGRFRGAHGPNVQIVNVSDPVSCLEEIAYICGLYRRGRSIQRHGNAFGEVLRREQCDGIAEEPENCLQHHDGHIQGDASPKRLTEVRAMVNVSRPWQC